MAAPVSETGLPLPRFVSLKSDQANIRTGPGKRYPITWRYQRKGMPVKIVNEYKHWRQVETPDGEKGWMHKSVLSGARMAMVMVKAAELRDKPNPTTEIKAKLMKHVIVRLEGCRRNWCEVQYKNIEGWLEKSSLWGV